MGGFIPPIEGLLAPQLKFRYTASHKGNALGLIGYIPEQDQRKPKAKLVENHWKPEDDLPPEVLKAFEKIGDEGNDVKTYTKISDNKES